MQGHTFLFSAKHLRTANSSASLSLSNFDMNSILQVALAGCLLYFSLETSAGSCQMRWSVLWYPHALVWATVCKPLFVHPRKV